MHKKNNANYIFNNTSGASLMFILGIMLMVMTIGISILTAASAGTGSALNKQTANRIELYSNSINMTVKNTLINESKEDWGKNVSVGLSHIDAPNTLGGQIIAESYKRYLNSNEISEFTLELETFLDNKAASEEDAIQEEKIPAAITINVNPTVKLVAPGEYTVNASSIMVTVNIEIDNKSKVTTSQYRLRNAILSRQNKSDDDSDFIISECGEWELVNYAAIDR